jgi:hypothetical protein
MNLSGLEIFAFFVLPLSTAVVGLIGGYWRGARANRLPLSSHPTLLPLTLRLG